MAKGAAKVNELGRMHSTLARVMQRTLDKYLTSLEALEKLDADAVEDELLQELMKISEPNPAMLSAISKFLKDNDIGLDSDEVEELNGTARSLAEKRAARRQAGLSLTDIPHVGEA